MNGEKFNSDRAPGAVGLYPHARKVGNLLFLSGVGPRKIGQKDIPGVKYILLKSRIHYRAGFETLPKHTLTLDGEGVTTSDNNVLNLLILLMDHQMNVI